MKELIQLISIRIKEFVREPSALFWTFFFPILMAWGLGNAFSSSGENKRNVVIINDTTQVENRLAKFMQVEARAVPATKYSKSCFEKTYENKALGSTIFKFIPANWDEAIVLLKKGQASLIVSYEDGNILYHFDPANPEAQLIYMQLTAVFDNNQSYFSETQYIRPLESKGTRYIDFLIPGLIAMSIMSSCLWGISYTLIEQRSKKLLRRMIATPMKKSNYLISHMIARILITSLEVIALVLFAYYVFDIEVQGSVIALITLILCGNIAFIGISFLISSRTSNTQVGNGLINMLSMPMMVLSGIFFSYHNFPEWVIPIIQKLPLTIFADGIRSIFIEGAGFAELYVSIFTLFGIGLVSFVVGLKIFKWH